MEPDQEFEAMRVLYQALEPLDDDARSRVVTYIMARLDIATESEAEDDAGDASQDSTSTLKQEQAGAPKFPEFAELFDTARPMSNANKALVAGYWLQICQSQEDFDGQSANKELKHLGEGIANITIAINSLRAQKPALVIQLRKSGKAKQARKTYKVTVSGIKAVEVMIAHQQ